MTAPDYGFHRLLEESDVRRIAREEIAARDAERDGGCLPGLRDDVVKFLGGLADDIAALRVRQYEQAARAEREAERLAGLELRNQRAEQIVRDATATIESLKSVLQSDDGREQSDIVRVKRLAQLFQAALDIITFGEDRLDVGDVGADECGGEHGGGDFVQQGLEHSPSVVGCVSVHDSSPSQVGGSASVGVRASERVVSADLGARPTPVAPNPGVGQSTSAKGPNHD